MKYQGVIFDLDGVICHTDQYHFKAWKMLADRLGIYFDEKINHRLRGVSRMESLEIILEHYDGECTQQEKLAYAQEKNGSYQKLLQQMTPDDLCPGVMETLETLRGLGIRLAIGSSSKNAQMILEKLGLDGFFDTVTDGNHITRSKPDGEVFAKAAAGLGLAPESCLVVEDAKAGLLAAKDAGMDSAGIADAAASPLATYRLEQIGDLLRIVA